MKALRGSPGGPPCRALRSFPEIPDASRTLSKSPKPACALRGSAGLSGVPQGSIAKFFNNPTGEDGGGHGGQLSLIHISEPTRLALI
eukprot:943723-Alexandrium_andersonii.AAC.1